MAEYKTFQGHPTWPYLASSYTCPNTVKYAKHGIWGAYLSTPNIVNRRVPERSRKMQFRRIDLVSIGPSSQNLWPNLIFGWFPHCNDNVKQKNAGGFCLWVYRFETFCGAFYHHLAALVQRTLQNSTRKFFGYTLLYITVCSKNEFGKGLSLPIAMVCTLSLCIIMSL